MERFVANGDWSETRGLGYLELGYFQLKVLGGSSATNI